MNRIIILLLLWVSALMTAQENAPGLLTIDRIYNSDEFYGDRQRPIFWVDNGDAFVTIENDGEGRDELVKHRSRDYVKSIFLGAGSLTPKDADGSLSIEDFTLSPDGTKILIFTNSRRVWRSNTKGDYWVYDLTTKKLKKIGMTFTDSSLMFAKFSNDNEYVAYVHDFNIYKEDFLTGKVKQLTFDGNGDVINGTFDWVYEEEFGQRDGFSWSPDATQIAFWQLNASDIGTFYMIDNTDSVYSRPNRCSIRKWGLTPQVPKWG